MNGEGNLHFNAINKCAQQWVAADLAFGLVMMLVCSSMTESI
jgi:hypothetical protein